MYIVRSLMKSQHDKATEQAQTENNPIQNNERHTAHVLQSPKMASCGNVFDEETLVDRGVSKDDSSQKELIAGQMGAHKDNRADYIHCTNKLEKNKDVCLTLDKFGTMTTTLGQARPSNSETKLTLVGTKTNHQMSDQGKDNCPQQEESSELIPGGISNPNYLGSKLTNAPNPNPVNNTFSGYGPVNIQGDITQQCRKHFYGHLGFQSRRHLPADPSDAVYAQQRRADCTREYPYDQVRLQNLTLPDGLYKDYRYTGASNHLYRYSGEMMPYSTSGIGLSNMLPQQSLGSNRTFLQPYMMGGKFEREMSRIRTNLSSDAADNTLLGSDIFYHNNALRLNLDRNDSKHAKLRALFNIRTSNQARGDIQHILYSRAGIYGDSLDPE